MNKELKEFLKKTFNLTETEFRENLHIDEVSSWDSLTHMTLVTGLEKEFNIELDVQDIVSLKSFPAIINILEQKGVEVV